MTTAAACSGRLTCQSVPNVKQMFTRNGAALSLLFFSFPPKLHRVKVFLCTGPKGPNLQTHKHVRIARVQVNQSCHFTRTNYMAACCCPVVVAAAAAPAAANCDLPRTIATRSCIARFTSRFEYHEHPHARTPAIRKSHAMPCHAMPCHPPPLSHSSRQPTNRPHNNNAAFGNCSLPATTKRTNCNTATLCLCVCV